MKSITKIESEEIKQGSIVRVLDMNSLVNDEDFKMQVEFRISVLLVDLGLSVTPFHFITSIPEVGEVLRRSR